MASIEMRVDANPEKLAPVLYHCFYVNRRFPSDGHYYPSTYEELPTFRQAFWRDMAREFIRCYTGI